MASDTGAPPSGRFARFRKLASLSAQLGTDALSRGVRRLAGQEAPALMGTGMAEKLVQTLGELKGAAMKLGQALSMDAELFPSEVRSVLARLQNQAPPMPFAQVETVLEEELGGPWARHFATVEPAPLAAASLGQVHRATLHDGTQVVVKVQYPGISEALRSDLENLGVVVRTFAKAARVQDVKAYFEEIRHQLEQEADYVREAGLAERFAAALAPFSDLCAPKVYRAQTSMRVLTLEYLPGATLRDWLAEEPSPSERLRVSRLLVRAINGPLLSAGWVHADPHGGNFLVMPDGRLGLLDFGAVKHVSSSFQTAVRALFLKAVRQEPVEALAHLRALGFTIELADEIAAQRAAEILHLAGPPLRTRDYDYGQSTLATDLRAYARAHSADLLKMRPPVEAVLFFRGVAGLSQNLRAIGARGDFLGMYQELAMDLAAGEAQGMANDSGSGHE